MVSSLVAVYQKHVLPQQQGMQTAMATSIFDTDAVSTNFLAKHHAKQYRQLSLMTQLFGASCTVPGSKAFAHHHN